MMDVVVITGTGGMGTAYAKRLGVGRHLMLVDFDRGWLNEFAKQLTLDGCVVSTECLDITDVLAVNAVAEAAAEIGPVRTIVHTAGISPTMADTQRIFSVDVFGACHVLDAF